MKSPYEPPKSELSDLNKSEEDSEENSSFSFARTGERPIAIIIMLILVAMILYVIS